jgi:2-amino-4-hydroxy-6-hydroxymethyldihydropteridine diphosphokinase
VALGSNLGDRLSNLRAACEALEALPGVEGKIRTSAVYETAPVDCPPGTPAFLNAAVEFIYAGELLSLFQALQDLECKMGRASVREKNAPRVIDLDLLYFGEITRSDAALTLPHPRITERAFVLAPLADLDPGLVLPGQIRPISELLAEIDPSGIRRIKLTLLNMTP